MKLIIDIPDYKYYSIEDSYNSNFITMMKRSDKNEV